ncbi:MAG TPA: AidA/PixA family protein [Methanosarcina sp.]
MSDKMSDNKEIINILIVIDSETILDRYGTNSNPDQPVQITQPDLIYIVTKQASVVSGQAGNELTFGAGTSNTIGGILWRATSLSLNSDNKIIFYKFTSFSSKNIISTPKPFLDTVKVPLPNPNDPTNPTIQEIQMYFWYSTVLNSGSATYHFCFFIVDRHGNKLGYYWWDPSITIKVPLQKISE